MTGFSAFLFSKDYGYYFRQATLITTHEANVGLNPINDYYNIGSAACLSIWTDVPSGSCPASTTSIEEWIVQPQLYSLMPNRAQTWR